MVEIYVIYIGWVCVLYWNRFLTVTPSREVGSLTVAQQGGGESDSDTAGRWESDSDTTGRWESDSDTTGRWGVWQWHSAGRWGVWQWHNREAGSLTVFWYLSEIHTPACTLTGAVQTKMNFIFNFLCITQVTQPIPPTFVLLNLKVYPIMLFYKTKSLAGRSVRLLYTQYQYLVRPVC